MVQQNLHSLNKFLINGVEEGILGLHFVLQEDLHHLQVLVVDGHEEGGATERVHTVDVDGSIVPAVLEHPEHHSEAGQGWARQGWARQGILLLVARGDRRQATSEVSVMTINEAADL